MYKLLPILSNWSLKWAPKYLAIPIFLWTLSSQGWLPFEHIAEHLGKRLLSFSHSTSFLSAHCTDFSHTIFNAVCLCTSLSFSPGVYASCKQGLCLTFLSLPNSGSSICRHTKSTTEISASCMATLPTVSLGLLSGKHPGCVIYWGEISAPKEA